MKKFHICFLLSFLTFTLVFGQNDKLIQIRQLYADTNDKIAKSKLPGEEGWGNLYSTEITVNSNNGSWRACGNYSNKITFWYKDQPGFQEDQEKSDYSVLVKIEVLCTCAVHSYSEEYLFSEGKLVFCYKKSNLEDPEQEYRYYFWNDKLFRYQENQTVLTDISKIGTKEVTGKSLNLQKLFLQTFN